MFDDPHPVAAYDSALVANRDRPAPVCRLVDWRPWHLPNASLFGHAAVAFNSGWIIGHIPIFRRADGSLSAGSPSMPQIGPDGRQKTDAAGKKLYAPVMQFEGEGRDLWSRTVVAALAAAGIGPAGAGEGAE